MICGRCDGPIRPDEPYDKIEKLGATNAGSITYRHRYHCTSQPQQTYPERSWRQPVRRIRRRR